MNIHMNIQVGTIPRCFANDPNAIQEFNLLRASDGNQELTLYLRNLTVIVEDLVADVHTHACFITKG